MRRVWGCGGVGRPSLLTIHRTAHFLIASAPAANYAPLRLRVLCASHAGGSDGERCACAEISVARPTRRNWGQRGTRVLGRAPFNSPAHSNASGAERDVQSVQSSVHVGRERWRCSCTPQLLNASVGGKTEAHGQSTALSAGQPWRMEAETTERR